MTNTISYSIYYPGGNTTALVEELRFDQQTRRKINDQLMLKEPTVEQVGFYSCEGLLQLQMAGGEFCGNAARSVAMTQYVGHSFTKMLRVSGVSQPIKVGVDQAGLAWSEIPVKTDSLPVQTMSNTSYLINLEGITHIVVQVPSLASILSKGTPEIKRDAYRMLKRFKLTESEPAAGVIYAENSQQMVTIVPVVWVRAIQTLFVETACGSGSMAVALQRAVTQNKNLTILVRQPSGEIIIATVAINSGQITQATIRGVVKLLRKGVLYVN